MEGGTQKGIDGCLDFGIGANRPGNPNGIQSESTTHILFVWVLKHATKPDFENKTAVLLAKLNVLINPGRNEGGQSFSPDEDGR